MASPVPAKSQPLHNFSLPHLKWKKNHTNNHHRGRRLADSSPPPPPPPSDAAELQPSSLAQSPIIDPAAESDSGHAVSLKNSFVSENRRSSPENLGKKSTQSDVDVDGGKERKSKIYIRIGKKRPEDVPEVGKVCTVEGEVEESVPKTWNLRPRRPIYKLSNGNGGVSQVGGSPLRENKVQLPQAAHNQPESEMITAEKKQKFSIPLSREEIEEDIFVMTGSKPSRRPKKRAKAVRKQLDNLFPGLWLGLITPDSYKISDLPAKG